MKIKTLKKILYISNDLNTHINDELQPLFTYKNDEETVKSIYVQDNGVVCIKTKTN